MVARRRSALSRAGESSRGQRDMLTVATQAIRHLGGIPLNKMMQEALDMGDEAHNRNNALASIVCCPVFDVSLF